VDEYKHQWNVIEAVAQLRQSGLPVKLDLVGSAYPPSLRRLKKSISFWDPNQSWAKYHGALPHEELRNIYIGADLGVFASSCENMPNILLEKMAAGLPIACANRGPTPEILEQSGIYFDPESPTDISRSIRQLIDSPSLRLENANFNFNLANQYSWDQCAADTFDFFRSIASKEKHESKP
jgi:glycosyltransferase involved in cell wall biosynthesis